MDIRMREAVRYLGYGRNAVDEKTLELISDSMKELEITARAKSIYRIFDLTDMTKAAGQGSAPLLSIGKMKVESRSLGRNLKGCPEVIMFAATLGTEVDLLLKRYSLTQMSKAVVLQACAAAYLEEYCDECQRKIADELREKKKWLRPRFSPGYGDFDIHHQEEILRMLDAPKRIGLTMTNGYMLTPTKSVTAVIGISTTEEKCHIKGCEVCAKRDCIFRRN